MHKCECKTDGYCQRYNRLMQGRFHEICSGVNVDLGTAAAFRTQWLRESLEPQESRESQESLNNRDFHNHSDSSNMTSPTLPEKPPLNILLRTDQAPGDAVAMTAAIYSLHTTYPGLYRTAVDSQWPAVFAHNPHVAPLPLPGAKPLHMHYPAIHQCNERGIHFMQAWCEHLGTALGIPIPLMTATPKLYFRDSDPEPPVDKGLWIVCSGGKRDFTNKLWGHENYQAVVSFLKGTVRFVQVGLSSDDHPPLDGVLNLVGNTNLRDLFKLVQQASGVLCGVSLLMHVAAALGKPAVVIAGGREPVQWNTYPKQHYLHTVGMLPCRSVQGHVGLACWRGRVVPLGDGTALDRDTCERPTYPTVDAAKLPGWAPAPRPACMTMIRPDHVAALIATHQS